MLTTTSAGTGLKVTQAGAGTAVRGSAVGPTSIAGFFTATNGTGISGVTARETSQGVYGGNDAASSGGGSAIRAAGKQNHGVLATASATAADAIRAIHDGIGIAVRAVVAMPSGSTVGIHGEVASPDGIGVRGVSTSMSGNTAAVMGTTASTAGIALYGRSTATTGTAYGVFGETSSSASVAAGAWGYAGATSGEAVGVYGQTLSTDGSAGVLGWAFATSGTAAGVVGLTASPDGTGVAGIGGASPSIGVYGSGSGNGYGVFSQGPAKVAGNLDVTGSVSKAGGGFHIDHPSDPANFYLNHSFVESPEMKNLYDGVVTLDADGGATIELPAWFEDLNRDVRYQLTPIGASAPVYVGKKVSAGRFSIAGGQPGQEVSWQVTGVRKDAWAEAHRIPVDEPKTGTARGHYLHPAEHGQPTTRGIPLPSAARHAIREGARRAPARPAIRGVDVPT